MRNDRWLYVPSAIGLLVGLWLVIAPWALGERPASQPGVLSVVIPGIVIALLAAINIWGATRSRVASWVVAALGLWVCLAPFLFGYAPDATWTWNAVISGLIVCALGVIDATTRPAAAKGEFRGVGPRGWRPSDEQILAGVCGRMADEPQLDASDIEVLVTNGEVTLQGTVASGFARRLAEDIADRVTAVRDVENQLRVRDRHGEVRRVA